MDDDAWRLGTKVVHTGGRPIEGAVVTPIFQSSTYVVSDEAQTYGEVVYVRLGNTPQHRLLNRKLAALEGAEQALVLSSGMAAVSTALLSVLSAGDHLLIQKNTYGGTSTFVTEDLPRWGITATEVDASAPETWAAALRPTTRAFYVESASNPLLEVPQLDAVVDLCRKHGLVSLIDNTFLSPVGFRPIPFGFDLVLHSATKVLNGHHDVAAGVIAGSAARVGPAAHLANHLGGALDPNSCFLLERGLKTLELRIARQTATALQLALFLAEHPAIASVRYPGLAGDPNHARARAFFTNFGAMIAVELRSEAAATRLIEALTIPVHAVSLGGVETLVVRPSRTSHLGLSPEARRALGITDALVRVSVGIEDPDDLLADFAQALEAV